MNQLPANVNRDELLLIGWIASAFGLRGQVKLRAVSDRLDHVQQQVQTVYLGQERTPHQLLSMFEPKPGLLVLTLSGVSDRDTAELLRRTEVYIHESDAAPLADDEYYIHDLYGLQVQTTDAEILGRVAEVLETGANEVLVVRNAGCPDLLIPMIADVVEELDIAAGQVIVRLPEGLR